MNINLRDRTTLRLPRRLQASDSSDTSEDNQEQVDELVEQVTSHSNSSSTSVSDETENLAALREALEELETSFLERVHQEEEQETPSNEDEQAQATMTSTTRFELDPYAGDINPAESDGRKLFLAATKEKDDDKKFTVKQDNAKLFMEANDARFQQILLGRTRPFGPCCTQQNSLNLSQYSQTKTRFRSSPSEEDMERLGDSLQLRSSKGKQRFRACANRSRKQSDAFVRR